MKAIELAASRRKTRQTLDVGIIRHFAHNDLTIRYGYMLVSIFGFLASEWNVF